MDLTPFAFGAYKVIKYAVYPLSWVILLLGLLTVLTLFPHSPRRLRWIRLLSCSSFLLLFALSTPLVGVTLMGLLDDWYPPFDPSRTARFDAIVVLGGGAHAKRTVGATDELSDLSTRRTTCGADLFLNGYAPKLLLSGGDGSIFRNGPKESVEMKRWARRLGVPEQAIFVEDRSRTTYENAVETKRQLGNASVLLVTSPYHLPRAVALFTKQGLSVTPVPCGYDAKNRPDKGWKHLTLFDGLPLISSLDATSKAITEIVGIVFYWASGKI